MPPTDRVQVQLPACAELADTARALARFTGVARRFEFRGEANGVSFVDDYAHHPTEVRASVAAARSERPQRLIAVFQPHLFSRTRLLAREFGEALSGADGVVTGEGRFDPGSLRGKATGHVLELARAAGVRAAIVCASATGPAPPGVVVVAADVGDHAERAADRVGGQVPHVGAGEPDRAAAHVVEDARKITVYLNDGTTYTGTVLGIDTIQDIALVKIDVTGLPVIELASGGSAELGQQVVVLGFALGSENLSVTTGVVSSSQYDSGTNVHWVQTDSAINPGNSGGPVLNLNGQIVGMVTEKAVGYAVEGVGYAISTETLLTYIQALEG